MQFTTIDIVLAALIALLCAVGMWRGIAGELAAVAWIGTALMVGFFLYSPVCSLVGASSKGPGGGSGVAAVCITVFLTLITALLVRFAVRKFVSLMLPQPWNAILGGLVGLLKGAVLVGLLAAVGLVQTGSLADGFFASRSVIVRLLARAAESYKSGAGLAGPAGAAEAE